MGGRGASSVNAGTGGISSAYSVRTADGQNLEFYFRRYNGETYYSNTINGEPQATPNGWTESQMIDRIVQNGGTVDKKTQSQLRDEYSQYQEDRRQTNEFLNQAYLTDRDFVRGSRANRVRLRASRRQ